MRFLFFSFFLYLFSEPGLLSAQKSIQDNREGNPLSLMKSKMEMPFIPVPKGGSDTVNFLVSFFENNLTNLKNTDSSTINLAAKINSPAGIHYTFIQTVSGIPVYSSQVKANLDREGNIRSYFDFTFPVIIPEVVFPPDSIASTELLKRYPGSNGLVTTKTGRAYFPVCSMIANGQPQFNHLVPALLVTVSDSLNRNYEMVIDRNGNVIFENDLNRYYSKNSKQTRIEMFLADSLVPALVFLPDPLTTAEVSYGAPYRDNDDADSPELNNQRKLVSMEVSYSGGVFTLESPWVKIAEFSAPVTASASNTIPEFYFSRNDDRFEDVNVFYHINVFQQYLQSLGFSNLAAYQVLADAHALNNADQSMYGNGQLLFGEGKVDDAEDGDVVIHEYGHAIQESAAPGTLSGKERRSLDEANGDYLASSYSRSLSEFAWDQVFTWDGHNRFWPGRWTTSIKCYPDDVTNDQYGYEFADIWSSTVMQVWEDIGRDTTDIILLQSVYSYASGMTMVDAAKLFLQADTILYGAIHAPVCNIRLSGRGLLGPCIYSIGDENNFRHRKFFTLHNPVTGTIIFDFPSYDDYRIQVFSATGVLVANASYSGSGLYPVPVDELSSGIYMVMVQNDDYAKVHKLVKY